MNGMTPIVKKVTALISGLVFLYGCYIILHGHLTPGGGFAGGTIIAGSFILLIIANGIQYFRLKKEKEESSLAEGTGILLFLLLATCGLFFTTHVFFGNFLPQGIPGDLVSAGAIPLYNIFTGIEVAAGLLSIFLAFVIYKKEE
ncbi:MAG TPA: MnhB domain-containing protein [Bacteroidales bacterium]|nr:MnhB domain-containing protein [Bacteroidales bacterium]